VHGGPNPVNGATVTLYATKTTASPSSSNNYGYGVAGTVLGTTTTNSSGAFSFTSPAACTAGQQAYIVAGGGHTGSNSTNNAAVLMAALGPCSSLVEGSSGTVVVINEATTIAAAYALSGFMTTTGNGSSAVVNISAPANNNAATAACTVTSNVTTACAASGLAHAFLNAANLVNPTTGVPNTTVATGSTITATVPQMLINTLANTVQACINSSGTITGTTAPCAILMTNTTPTELTSPTAPTNSLQALLYLAQYPSMVTTPTGTAAPSAATTALFNLANSNATYAPALTAAPDDFTIGINYVLAPPSNASLSGGTTEISLTVKGTTGYTTASSLPTTTSGSGTGMLLNIIASSGALTGGSVATAGTGYALGDKIYPTQAGSDGTAYFTVVSQGAGAPWGIATDIHDNVYVYTLGAVAGGPASPSVYSLTSNGAQNWLVAAGTLGGCSTYNTRCGVVPDTLGNVWVTDKSGLTEITSGGSLGTTFTTVDIPTDAIVDQGNNVWMAAYATTGGLGAQSTPSELEELPRGASSIVDVQVGGAVVSGTTPLRDPVFDSAGNLWAASDNAGGAPGALLMISSNNSLSAPSFSFSSTSNPEIIQGGAGANLKSSSPMIDGSGNMWITSEDELNEVPSSGSETGGAALYNTSMTLTYGGSGTSSGAWDSTDERYAVMDGNGKIIVDGAAGSEGYLSVYYPNAPSDGFGGSGEGGANVYLNPCFTATATTVCALTSSDKTSQIVNAARGSAIDASGAIWASFSSGLNVVQILGPGAPSWSQTSWIPKALAPNLTGPTTGTTSLRPF
jgi:hypothetical protein